jgi:hypothetical protein
MWILQEIPMIRELVPVVSWRELQSAGFRVQALVADEPTAFIAALAGIYQLNFHVPATLDPGPFGIYPAWPCGNYSWELGIAAQGA